MIHHHDTINCKGTLLNLQSPVVMGILNVTPDSFYDGGRFGSLSKQLLYVERMVEDGVTMVDVGGMSTRPGAALVSVEEELKRVLPTIEAIESIFPEVFVSIDTVHSKVAKEAIKIGAHIVNDISAGTMDDKMFETVVDLDVPYILMHMQGTPSDMQHNPTYENVVHEVLDFLINKIGKLRALGVKDIIVDPGFGFGKTLDNNYQLLKNLHAFKMLEAPLLAGISRKSMICKALKVYPEYALNGTTALHMVALQQGAKILRVHDVKEAVECVNLFNKLEEIE